MKFRLHGEKLRGGFALVKIGSRRQARDEDRSWLLIKERDAEAAPSGAAPIVESQPASVASGRSIEQIAAAEDRVWHSNRNGDDAKMTASPIEVSGAKRAALPKFVQPELATLVERPPEGDSWLHELKRSEERRVGKGR